MIKIELALVVRLAVAVMIAIPKCIPDKISGGTPTIGQRDQY